MAVVTSKAEIIFSGVEGEMVTLEWTIKNEAAVAWPSCPKIKNYSSNLVVDELNQKLGPGQ